MALLAPAPLMLLALRPGLSPGRAGMYAALGVAPWWAWAHLWTVEISRAGIYPLVLYLSLYAWVFVWAGGRVAARWPGWAALTLAVVWVGLEFLRGGVAFEGYGFYLTAHPLLGSPGGVLAATAGWWGTYGVSLLVAGVAAGAAVSVATGRARPVVVGAAAGAVVFALGALSQGDHEGERTLRVGVAQSNIPQDNRMAWTFRQRVADWRALRDLSVQAAEEGADVIVWPEGLMPGRTLQPEAVAAERDAGAVWPMSPQFDADAPGLGRVPDYLGATSIADELMVLQRALGVPMVIGASGYDGFRVEPEGGGLRYRYEAIYNSVFLVDGGEVLPGRYDKLRLAPFGEVMPYISAWPWLEGKLLAVAAEGMSFVLSPGGEPRLLEVPGGGGSGEAGAGEARSVAVATPVCFEATDPRVCRRLVFEGGRRRAGVMVSISNDGWFGDSTAGREAYVLASRWRCVELGTPLVRAANTGISGAYDARGRVITEAVLGPDGVVGPARDRVSGVLMADVPVGMGRTLYALVGEALGWGALGGTLALLVGALWGPRGGRSKGAAPGGRPE